MPSGPLRMKSPAGRATGDLRLYTRLQLCNLYMLERRNEMKTSPHHAKKRALCRQKDGDGWRRFILTHYGYNENLQVPSVQIKIELYKLKKIQFIYTIEVANVTV